jgi:hypothetical protein
MDTAASVGVTVLKPPFGFSRRLTVHDDQIPKPENTLLMREHRAGVVVDRAQVARNLRGSGSSFGSTSSTRGALRRPGLYDGEVAYTHREFARLLAAVASKARVEPSPWCRPITAENLGEHAEGMPAVKFPGPSKVIVRVCWFGRQITDHQQA